MEFTSRAYTFSSISTVCGRSDARCGLLRNPPLSNSNELRAALAVAERNGEDDIIKLFLAHELMDILTSS
ncbi:MAG: hypothetical protein IH874_00050 [Candidatus Dadabacteria bacterium]|nr:hypothetical protein [Candidatus Dadabacteria bacterium]